MIKNKIQKYDLSNMYEYLQDFPKQIDDSINIINLMNIKKNVKYSSILFCGMGGSSIGGKFVISLIQNELNIPVFNNNDYSIPKWVNKNTLIVITSYSGNTEESLSCMEFCIKQKIVPVTITSGGKLLHLSEENNFTSIVIPKGFPPRCAFGYLSSSLLLLLIKLQIVPSSYEGKLYNSINLLKKYSDIYSNITKDNKVLELAENLLNSNIIIYSTPNTKVCGYRLKSQLAENSKILSFYHYLPEMNHNDIEGYGNLINKNYSIIWITDLLDDKRVKSRVLASSKTLDFIKKQYFVNFNDENIVLNNYHMIYYFDWVSFYLSILYNVNPTPVTKIESLKSKLK